MKTFRGLLASLCLVVAAAVLLPAQERPAPGPRKGGSTSHGEVKQKDTPNTETALGKVSSEKPSAAAGRLPKLNRNPEFVPPTALGLGPWVPKSDVTCIAVLGQVKEPNYYAWQPGMTMRDAIIAAKGVRRVNANKIYLITQGDAGVFGNGAWNHRLDSPDYSLKVKRGDVVFVSWRCAF